MNGTNSVEASTVTGSAGQDSTVYAYTEIEYADSAFNGKQDVWDAAQATLGTTTVVPEIYVENGAVTIGIRGNGRVGGNDSWFLEVAISVVPWLTATIICRNL